MSTRRGAGTWLFYPSPKQARGTHGPCGLFRRQKRSKKHAPFRRQGSSQGFRTRQKCRSGSVAGLMSPHGEEPFSSPRPFGNRPGTSPRPGARKNTSALSFPRPDGTPPGSTLPACAAARHLPERTRGTTTDDVRRVRTRLNAGRPNAAVCLYRHARRPIFFPAARKARADTAPR